MSTIKTMKSKLYRHNASKIKGMTLIELIVSIAIFVIIMVAVTAFEINVFSYRRNVAGSFEVAQNAQMMLKSMTTDLRSMAPGANGAYPLVSAGTSTVTFFSDVDNDGVTEQVRYFLSNGELYRGVTRSSGSPAAYNQSNETVNGLLANVANNYSMPIFSYYDENYSGTSSPLAQPIQSSSVRLIEIDLSLTSLDSASSSLYTTDIMLRNLKDNL